MFILSLCTNVKNLRPLNKAGIRCNPEYLNLDFNRKQLADTPMLLNQFVLDNKSLSTQKKVHTTDNDRSENLKLMPNSENHHDNSSRAVKNRDGDL